MHEMSITMRHVITVKQGENVAFLGQDDVRRFIAASINAAATGKTDDLHQVVNDLGMGKFIAPPQEGAESLHPAQRIPVVGELVSFYEGNQPVQIRQGTVVSFEKPPHYILLITVEMPNGTKRTITALDVVGRIYG